ncbi:MAG: LPP20 family lipoprotein [Helicobacteraceae bacterium]|jgi:hypothetical protein|nr:LPP20 family lipoprotein [Helicobacteraceae bacterium]
MRVATLITLAVVGVGLVSCAPKGPSVPAPQWVTGASQYAPSRYITGVGSGTTQDIAADRARNDLAKTISISVESSERSKTSSGAGGYESAFSSAVNVRVNQTVGGVEIVDRYYDDASKIYYALAALDRSKSAASLRAELAQKELEIDALVAEAEDDSDALGKLRALNAAGALLGDRRSIAALLAVIDAMPSSAYANEGRVAAAKRALLRSIKFSVNGNYEGKRLLNEAIGAAGFTLTQQDESDYSAVGYYKISVNAENGWLWATASLLIEIVDYSDGATKKTETVEAKESSQNEQTAKERALEKLRGDLTAKFYEIIAK